MPRLQPIPTRYRLDAAKIIRGWTSETELAYLASLAQHSEQIIEIGSFAGRTARAMADNTSGFLLCIDPLDPTIRNRKMSGGGILATREDGDVVHGELCANLADHVLAGRVEIERDRSHIAIPRAMNGGWGRKFDLAFIDGDHAYESVKLDIALCLAALRPGGVLVGDDYFETGPHPGVKRAVDEMFGGRFTHPAGKLWRVNL